MKRNNYGNEPMKGLFIALIGIAAILWVFQQPCDVGPITQEYQGQTIEVNQPEKLDRLVCLSADPTQLIVSAIGLIALWSGGQRFFNGV